MPYFNISINSFLGKIAPSKSVCAFKKGYIVRKGVIWVKQVVAHFRLVMRGKVYPAFLNQTNDPTKVKSLFRYMVINFHRCNRK